MNNNETKHVLLRTSKGIFDIRVGDFILVTGEGYSTERERVVRINTDGSIDVHWPRYAFDGERYAWDYSEGRTENIKEGDFKLWLDYDECHWPIYS